MPATRDDAHGQGGHRDHTRKLQANPDSNASRLDALLMAIREHRYIREHLRRAIREHGDAPISAQSVAERAAYNISRGRLGVLANVEYLKGEARDMLRRRWGGA